MAEKEGRISEEGSAGRDIAEWGPWVKGSGAEISDQPARERLRGLGLRLPSQRMTIAFGSSGPWLTFCSSPVLLKKPKGQVISAVHHINKAADLCVFISRWVTFWTAETKKRATLLKRSCVVMTEESRLLGAHPGAPQGGAAPSPGRQRCSTKAVGCPASWPELPLCYWALTAAPKCSCCPSTRQWHTIN